MLVDLGTRRTCGLPRLGSAGRRALTGSAGSGSVPWSRRGCLDRSIAPMLHGTTPAP